MEIRNSSPVRVFRFEDGDKVKYTVGISKKIKDTDEYERAYFPIQFNNGVEVEDKQKILIKNAWLSFYNWEFQEKKGTSFFIKCSQFDLVSDDEEPQMKLEEIKDTVNDIYSDFGNSIEIDDSEIAF